MCGYVILAPFLANASACSFPAIWQCPGIHCSAICLCFAVSCRIWAWQSLASVDITVSVDPADSIAAVELEKITALSNLSRCRFVADACECGNEPSGSVKCGEFLD